MKFTSETCQSQSCTGVQVYRSTGVQVYSEDWWDKATRQVYLTQNRPDDVWYSSNTTLLSDELLA